MIINQISIALVKEFFQKQLQIYRPLTFKVSFMLWTIEEKKSFMLWTIEEKKSFMLWTIEESDFSYNIGINTKVF